jgi:hypothetical protein
MGQEVTQSHVRMPGYYRSLTSKHKNSINGDAVTFMSESGYVSNRALVNAPTFKALQAAGELVQRRWALLFWAMHFRLDTQLGYHCDG